MIPKIIHYTWFSGEPFPNEVQKCMESWHTFMPDYEFICWDSERIKEIESIWLEETLDAKKWAFAADLVRLYAVYKYGGIYLDTDCMLFKSLDEFRKEKCFIGKEDTIHIKSGKITEMYLTSHCFGAESGNPFICKCLSYYQNRHFRLVENMELPMELKYCTLILPYIQCEIAKQEGYCSYPSSHYIQRLQDLTVYPNGYFDSLERVPITYCQHLCLGGWRESKFKKKEPVITFSYKLKWRFERYFRPIAEKFGYLLIEKL